MDIKKLLQTFSSLPIEKQLEKITSLLTELKDSDPIFASLLAKIKKQEPNTATLLVIYHDVLQFAQAAREYNNTQGKSSLEKAEQHMEKLRKREQQEKLEDAKDLAAMESLIDTL